MHVKLVGRVQSIQTADCFIFYQSILIFLSHRAWQTRGMGVGWACARTDLPLAMPLRIFDNGDEVLNENNKKLAYWLQ